MEPSNKQREQQQAYAAHITGAEHGSQPGEQYLERWRELDEQLVKQRHEMRKVDMALTACNKTREEDDGMDVGQARFALEAHRRQLAERISHDAADAALLLLLRRIDPQHDLPRYQALPLLRAVGPARLPQTVRVVREVRKKCREAYTRNGDTRSKGHEDAAALLEQTAVEAYLKTEESQMVYISMLEPCIASHVAFTEDEELAARAAKIDMFETEPPTREDE